ncbi:YveK family protein [Lysinibacillus xylanilyticus]|uniref:Wzz/FepE/Etk N-terminal domain-containing protein n=1 Tax=Lysinibacillus xylanilyticus TaxID=582475 RepID=A0ABT4EMI8_9BACI|nr:Wzz/FepE/Etk N-terminal domain-containing protein [Lysinibacillus xylanilyticus]MCY9545706.1 Wzz/FepE/Etk N-terminal domain-containing protein [Lysinibacillus xylanilyticus]
MEKTINLFDFIKILKKRFILIMSLTALLVGIAAVMSYFVLTPVYQSETQILVNQKLDAQQQSQFEAQKLEIDLQLINTYSIIIKSPVILTKVIERLDLNTTPEQLMDQISVTNANNSQVVSVKVKDPDYKQAVEIANTLAEVFKREIPVLMSVDNITILSSAKVSEYPVPIKPNKLLNLVIGGVFGFFIGMAIALLLEVFNKKIKSEHEVEEILEFPIIGYISPIK